MKEFIEEYGGIIVACIMGISLLGILYFLLGSDENSLFELIAKIYAGLGIQVHSIS